MSAEGAESAKGAEGAKGADAREQGGDGGAARAPGAYDSSPSVSNAAQGARAGNATSDKQASPAGHSYFDQFRARVPARRCGLSYARGEVRVELDYYDFGPKGVVPLLCLHDVGGTAACFFRQIGSLSSKGFRVIAVTIPLIWDVRGIAAILDRFLDNIKINTACHVWGVGLGALVAQHLASAFPQRVGSGILTNGCWSTVHFSSQMMWPLSTLQLTPRFVLSKWITDTLPSGGLGPRAAEIAEMLDFYVSQLGSLTQEQLASRMHILYDDVSAGDVTRELSQSVTFLDTLDCPDAVCPEGARNELLQVYPRARRGSVKQGGRIPHLLNADEITMHVQVHLRRLMPDFMPVSQADRS